MAILECLLTIVCIQAEHRQWEAGTAVSERPVTIISTATVIYINKNQHFIIANVFNMYRSLIIHTA